MQIIIYESSSKGGCYKYATELYKAYQLDPKVDTVTLLLPSNSHFEGTRVKKILMADNKMGNKLNFLLRHFVNPLLLWWYLGKRQKTLNGKTFVLLNDFEQMSAPFWSPLFRFTLSNRYTFGAFLHDSDRDNYPPSPRVSAWCMREMMKCMQLALYHGTLPTKNYYENRARLQYIEVEHGLYPLPKADEKLKAEIAHFREEHKHIVGVIGHIRLEKNYSLLMQAIVNLPNYAILVAGSVANSNIDVEQLKNQAKSLGICNRILWIDRYLSEAEMTAVIESCNTIALYYASTFSAQSGILNQVATLRKTIIVSDLPNALTKTVRKYNLGYICKADDLEALTLCIGSMENKPLDPKWDLLFEDGAWSKQVELVLKKI